MTRLSLKEDGFAFDTATGESYTLNPCGCLIVERLHKGETSQQIVDFLSCNFKINQSMAQRDIEDFCQQLTKLGLLGVNR